MCCSASAIALPPPPLFCSHCYVYRCDARATSGEELERQRGKVEKLQKRLQGSGASGIDVSISDAVDDAVAALAKTTAVFDDAQRTTVLDRKRDAVDRLSKMLIESGAVCDRASAALMAAVKNAEFGACRSCSAI